MKKRTSLAIFAISIVLATILGIILSGIFLANITSADFPFEIPAEFMPVIIVFVTLKTVVSLVNMALLFLILAIYVDIYRKIKTRFTAGLLLMILVLLMQALTSNPLLQFRFGFPVIGFGPFSIIPDLFTTVALIVLLYLSFE